MVSPLFDLFHDLMGKTGETVATKSVNFFFPADMKGEWKKGVQIALHAFF